MVHAREVQRVRRSAEQWRAILAEWSGSGLSQAEFCRRRGFSKVTFNGWKRHFRTAAPASLWPQGIAIRGAAGQGVARHAGPARPTFVEVASGSCIAEPALYEVRLANGRTVRVGPDFEPATLQRLLAIVEAHASGEGAAREC